MKTLVVGLGLMGASYASMLTKLGHSVYGYDINNKIYNNALDANIIKESTFPNIIKNVDLVIITLYPKDVINFLKEHEDYFNNTQIITDIAGVKKEVMNYVLKEFKYKENYVSHHPMAGREKQNTFFYDDKMFQGANCIIIENKYVSKNKHFKLSNLLGNFRFRKIINTSTEKHDFLIAYTSQLAHAIAISLINVSEDELTFDATGDSFRDLTRIAKINEVMWSELFLDNKLDLINQIDLFTHELSKVKDMLINNDKDSLKKYMKKSNDRRVKYDKNRN